MSKILVVDDEVQLRTLLSRMLELEGYEVCQAGDCRTALKQLEFQSPDVVLCDVFLPDGNGVDLVSSVKKTAPNVEIILLTAHGNIPDGVQAIKNGAFDYITKGDDNNKIIPLVSRAVEKARMNVRLEKLEKKVGHTYSFDSVLGDSKALKDAVSLAQKVSGTDVPVLLTGETGTGKEVFAQAIHYNSKRAKQNFVAVNCSSFSKELLESEMFGHKAGSFTGALKDKKGLFEEADNGTIFLDEIGEMAFELQAKLLRILETGEYIKIGDTKPTRVNVRVVAATNRNLPEEITAGRFREDLFYRLSVFQIHLPPLRERAGDVRILAKAFVKDFSVRLARPVTEITPAFLEALEQQPWKGNIRELRNVIERSLIVCESERLDVADLPLDIQNTHYEQSDETTPGSFELSAMERRHIARVLEYTKGNKTEAARLLSSLSDETPEGKSIIELGRENGHRMRDLNTAGAHMIKFTAETKCSGVDLQDGTQIRKGAFDAIRRIVESAGNKFPKEVEEAIAVISGNGGTPLVVCVNKAVLGVIELQDIIKPGIQERFERLRKMGVKTVMVTGDNPLTAKYIAEKAGVDDFIAEAKPEDKMEYIKKEQQAGKLVAMMGDGTNDAPALAQANVGVAMNSGTQAAKEAGNMVDLDNDPTKLIEIVEIGKQLLMTRGTLTTFSIANDVAKYFAIIPALFMVAIPQLAPLNIMGLHSPETAILSAIIFNAVIIPILIPLALRGVRYKPIGASALLRRNLLIYGLGGVIAPFIGIKLIDMFVCLFF